MTRRSIGVSLFLLLLLTGGVARADDAPAPLKAQVFPAFFPDDKDILVGTALTLGWQLL
jgi:hypothetical protein